jgi:hypothetical protein
MNRERLRTGSPHESCFHQGGEEKTLCNVRALQAARRVFLPLCWFFLCGGRRLGVRCSTPDFSRRSRGRDVNR